MTRRRFFGALTGAVGLACGEAVFEPHTLDVTEHEVSLPGLPRRLDGYKVALLTDLHRGELTPDASFTTVVDDGTGARGLSVAEGTTRPETPPSRRSYLSVSPGRLS